ncbi:MAG TPA: nitrilase-related carbon-nitrogen hydrolase, partial [Burkholderiaceae bacterium]|nr:nitrilase-related carbon-nitrogen hydrolase [Burkholderiaceae bacterium]
LQAYDTTAGRIGGCICWEHWMPLNRFAMHALGEQIHVAAFPDIPEHNALASRHYAFEGRCFVIAMGSVLRRDDIKMDFGLVPELLVSPGRTGDRDEFVLAGGSGIIGPDGQWIVEQNFYEETIMYADLDLSAVSQEKLSLDSAGHYNRPDVFQLSVNTRCNEPLRWSDDASQHLRQCAGRDFN